MAPSPQPPLESVSRMLAPQRQGDSRPALGRRRQEEESLDAFLRRL